MTYDIGCPVLDKMHRSLYDKTIVILNTSTRTRTNRLKAEHICCNSYFVSYFPILNLNKPRVTSIY